MTKQNHIEPERKTKLKRALPSGSPSGEKPLNKDVGSEIAKRIHRNTKIREEMMKWKKMSIFAQENINNKVTDLQNAIQVYVKGGIR